LIIRSRFFGVGRVYEGKVRHLLEDVEVDVEAEYRPPIDLGVITFR
jgi:hypothetical protein